MDEEGNNVELTPILIVIIIINCFIVIISLYLTFLYIKSKELHSYSCRHIIVLSLSILIDNLNKKINKFNVLLRERLQNKSSIYYYNALCCFNIHNVNNSNKKNYIYIKKLKSIN